MKSFFILLSIVTVVLISSGCSRTWNGVKGDSNEAWEKTKETINEATR